MAIIVASRPAGVTAAQEIGGNPIGETRLQISNEELFRLMPFGSKWNQIRVGIRFAFWGGILEAGTFSTLAGGNFWIGVSEYNCGLLSNSLVGDFLMAGYGGGTWTCAGSPAYYSTAGNMYFYRKYGATLAGTSVGFGTPYFSADPRYIRSVLYAQITKVSSTNYNCYVYAPNTAGLGQTDWSRAEFQKGMWNSGTPTNTAASGQMVLARAGARDIMDHAIISWSQNVPVPEIWDFAVTRMY